MYGSDIDSLRLEIFHGGGWSIFFQLDGQQQSSGGSQWKLAALDLGPYLNDTIAFRFTAIRKNVLGKKCEIAIDDISVREKVTCEEPSSLVATSLVGGANLQWNGGGASDWQIKYRQKWTSLPFTYAPANTNPFNITGLKRGTTYDFWVRDSCGPGDVSYWSDSATVTTECGFLTAPWKEDFEGPEWVPGSGPNNVGYYKDPCWEVHWNSSYFGVWSGPTATYGTGPSSGYGGAGKYIYSESDWHIYFNSVFIASPLIYIPKGSKNVSFKFAYHMYGAGMGTLNLIILTDSNYTMLQSFSGQQQSSPSDPWKMADIDISAFAGDTIQIRFSAFMQNPKSDMAVDEISIDGDICLNPSAGFNDSVQMTKLILNSSPTTDADSLFWDFGDGNSDTAANPVHTYAQGGVYEVWLKAYNECAADSISKTIFVCDTIRADFSTYTRGDSVELVADTIGNNALGYRWTFWDGSQASGPIAVVSADTSQTMHAELMAYNACGDTLVRMDSIRSCISPVASWSYNIVSTTAAGMQVWFDASASQNAYRYIWDFGDGNIDSSGAQVQHLFATAGLHHKIKLVVKNECGSKDQKVSSLKAMVGLLEEKPRQITWLYPNPADQYLAIEWPSGEGLVSVLQVYDIFGKLVLTKACDNEDDDLGKVSINTSHLPEGMYVVSLKGPDLHQNQQIIIAH